MNDIENISGGFRGEPSSVAEWMRRELADPKTRTAVEREVEKLKRVGVSAQDPESP